MPLPLAPVAGFVLRYGSIALATYALTRHLAPGRRDQRAEDALDALEEGLTYRREAEQANAGARFRRVIRIGEKGPGIEIGLSALGRLRIRKL